jgi:hypothetical protein
MSSDDGKITSTATGSGCSIHGHGPINKIECTWNLSKLIQNTRYNMNECFLEQCGVICYVSLLLL